MTFKKAVAAAAVGAAITATAAGPVTEARAADAPAIVLIHGAWANGSSWARVVLLLQARGFEVVAAHIPLSSFEADVAATRRVIESQTRDVILVGHSYGGAVITEAGTGNKVRALVYVAAFAPSNGESVNGIVGAHGKPAWSDEVRADAGGMLTWSAKGMAKYFAPDLPAQEAALLAATQAPLFAGAFDGKVTLAAFSKKPSWNVVADEDRIIPAPLQRAFADKMGAKTSHVASSHVPMLSQPQVVADAILAAADSAK
jgi:pimeloyl-ACP methyl ester carboxylesterase